MQAHPQNVWFGENPGKICGEIRAKCVNTFAKSLYVLWFYKNSTPNKSANVFLWRSCFYLVLFGQVRGNLGKFGENLGKNGAWSALIWKNAPNVKRNAVVFFGGHFLWSIFRARLGNLGKSFAPPRICLLLHPCFSTRNVTKLLTCAFLSKPTILNNGKCLNFFFNNMLLAVNAISGAAWCCWRPYSLVDEKLQKKFHS